eukprot:7274089-Prymnesium_polylepis.1
MASRDSPSPPPLPSPSAPCSATRPARLRTSWRSCSPRHRPAHTSARCPRNVTCCRCRSSGRVVSEFHVAVRSHHSRRRFCRTDAAPTGQHFESSSNSGGSWRRVPRTIHEQTQRTKKPTEVSGVKH